MPWRVCRVLDFTKHCTSVHSNEEVAKIETGNQLLSLVGKLEESIPMYRGPWAYDKYHPGFVDDMIEMIQAVRRRVEDGDVWGAYDDWHRFLQHWDRVLSTPLWVQVGTVLVEGPGPTVIPAYNPSYSMKAYRHHPRSQEVATAGFDIKKGILGFVQDLTKVVIREKYSQTGEQLDTETVVNETIRIMDESDFDPAKEQDQEWAWSHYLDLVVKNVYERFGLEANR